MKFFLFSSFLEGSRKEAKELLPKFNARDESRSLFPVDDAFRAIKNRFIHRSPIRSSSEISSQHAFRIVSVILISIGGLLQIMLAEFLNLYYIRVHQMVEVSLPKFVQEGSARHQD
jgi:hypothetical protein